MSAEHDDTGVGVEARPAPAPLPPVVLIVEDERSIAAVVAEVVAELGCTPMVAAQGRQALELARERWPALLITDLMMPRMGGAALIVALREMAALQGVSAPPILLLTAASGQYARAADADAILRKPFNLVELEALIHRLLSDGPALHADP